MSTAGSDPAVERIEILLRYSDVILSNEDRIRAAFEENIDEFVFYPPDIGTVGYGIRLMLSPYVDDEDMSAFVRPLLNFLLNISPDSLRKLRDAGANAQLVDFLAEMGMKYHLELNQISLVGDQGLEYWREVDSEIVIRDSGRIGFSHRLVTGLGDELGFGTDLNSNINLVTNLLHSQLVTYEQLPKRASEQTDPDALSQLEEVVSEIKGQVKDKDQ